jgi:hypothetical protein
LADPGRSANPADGEAAIRPIAEHAINCDWPNAAIVAPTGASKSRFDLAGLFRFSLDKKWWSGEIELQQYERAALNRPSIY